MISNFFTNKISLANKWMCFSSSNSALVVLIWKFRHTCCYQITLFQFESMHHCLIISLFLFNSLQEKILSTNNFCWTDLHKQPLIFTLPPVWCPGVHKAWMKVFQVQCTKNSWQRFVLVIFFPIIPIFDHCFTFSLIILFISGLCKRS